MKRHFISLAASIVFWSSSLCAVGHAEKVLPKSAFTVAIDVGHSPEKGGALSARGKHEYYFNREVALALRRELRKAGFVTAFIIGEKVRGLTLTGRTTIARRAGSRLFISLHHDSVQTSYLQRWSYQGRDYAYCDEKKGFSIFISEENPESLRSLTFARMLADHLLAISMNPTLHHAENIPGENRKLLDRERGIYANDNLAILRSAKMPAVLLECGVIVNRKEEIMLSSRAFQAALAGAITEAVSDYYASIIN